MGGVDVHRSRLRISFVLVKAIRLRANQRLLGKQGLLKTVKLCNVVYVDTDASAEFEKHARKGRFAEEVYGAAADMPAFAKREAIEAGPTNSVIS